MGLGVFDCLKQAAKVSLYHSGIHYNNSFLFFHIIYETLFVLQGSPLQNLFCAYPVNHITDQWWVVKS